MLKNPSKYKRDTSQGKIHHFFRHFLLLCYYMTLLVWLPESSGGRISFPCRYHSTIILHVSKDTCNCILHIFLEKSRLWVAEERLHSSEIWSNGLGKEWRDHLGWNSNKPLTCATDTSLVCGGQHHLITERIPCTQCSDRAQGGIAHNRDLGLYLIYYGAKTIHSRQARYGIGFICLQTWQ
jgi:hypothetical protein